MFTSPALRPVCSSTAFTTRISLQQDWECEIFTCSTAAADLWVERVGARGMTRSEKYWKLWYSPATLRGFISKHTVSLCGLCLCMFRFNLPSSAFTPSWDIIFALTLWSDQEDTKVAFKVKKTNKEKCHSLLIFFSHYKVIHGWATWNVSWVHYITQFTVKNTALKTWFTNTTAATQ